MPEFVIADSDNKVIAGPFGSSKEISEYSYAHRRDDDRPWTLFLLEVPPTIYRIVDGQVVATGEAENV